MPRRCTGPFIITRATMLRILFLFCLFPTAAFADVAVSIGFKNGKWQAYSSGEGTELLPHDARESALQKCHQDRASQCQHMLYTFKGYCGAVAVSSDGRFAGRGSERMFSGQVAADSALAVCSRPKENEPAPQCRVVWEYCYEPDTIPRTVDSETRAAPQRSSSSSNEPPPAIVIFLGIVAVVGIVFGLAQRGKEYRKATAKMNRNKQSEMLLGLSSTRSSKAQSKPTKQKAQKSTATKAPAARPAPVVKQESVPNTLPAVKAPKSLPANTMQLKLKRSQRKSTFGAAILILDARMEVSQDVLQNIKKYKLGKRLVYESANREKYRANAQGHLENSRSDVSLLAFPGKQALGLGKTFYKLARSGISAGISALSLKITIDSLIAGVHVECKDLDELLAAEDAIKIAGQNLKGYLSMFSTFDGDEQVVEL